MFRNRLPLTDLAWKVTLPTTIAVVIAVGLIVVVLGGCGGAGEQGVPTETETGTAGTPPRGFTLTADKLGKGSVTSSPPVATALSP